MEDVDTMTGEQLNQLRVGSAAFRKAYGRKASERTPAQHANMLRAQEYSRSKLGVGPEWNS